MIVETRKTAQGTEYWDAVKQRTLFVPTGNTPPFEVMANPTSLIVDETETIVHDEPPTDETQFEDMTIKELRDYAAEFEIDILDDVKKKVDIIALLTAADAE